MLHTKHLQYMHIISLDDSVFTLICVLLVPACELS